MSHPLERQTSLLNSLDRSGSDKEALFHISDRQDGQRSVTLMTRMFGIFQCNHLITTIKSIDFSLIADCQSRVAVVDCQTSCYNGRDIWRREKRINVHNYAQYEE